MPDIWEMLEETAPAGCEPVQDLYSWSTNFDPGRGPFALYLDLIGWSFDELGAAIYDLSRDSLGYLELAKLGAALTAYANDPHAVRAYVDALMAAESES